MMTRDKANEIARDMLAALQDVAKKHGIQIKDKGGRFDPNGGNATFKFEAAFLNAQGTAETRERTAFTRQAKFFNLKPEWLDMEFAFAGDDYKIIGLNTKAYKAPVLAIQSSNGKTYKFKAEHVEEMMRAQHPTVPATPAV